MLQTLFRSADVERADRFDYWCDAMSRIHAPMHMTSEHAHDFEGEMRYARLGEVLLWPSHFDPATFHRSARLIRRDDPEVYHLSYVAQGGGQGEVSGRQRSLRPAEFHSSDSSRPWYMRSGAERVHVLCMDIPKQLLPFPRDRADSVIGQRITAREGVGGLLAGILIQLTSHATTFRPSDAPRLETVLVDLTSALFAHVLEAQDAVSPEAQRRVLALRVRSFIRGQLHDPDLSPSSIAAAHHISVSYLHRLFRDEGSTVSAYLRAQRLERARKDLSGNAERPVPVHEIAARWGFRSHAVFSRSFRSAYGVTPKEFRFLHRGGAEASSGAPVAGEAAAGASAEVSVPGREPAVG